MIQNQKKKGIVCFAYVLLVALFMALCLPINVSADDMTDLCGESVSWTFDNGTLTVSGEGDMTNYTTDLLAPWQKFAKEITSVVIEDGVTSVGAMSFYGCTAVASVRIPDSVVKIGSFAFMGCEDLTQVFIGNGVVTIGQSAFEACSSLTSIRLPSSLETIDERAFSRCYELKGITIPESVTSLGKVCFAYDYALSYADICSPIETLPFWCFYGCTSLMNLKLSDTIESLDENALYGCNTAVNVTYNGSADIYGEISDQLTLGASDHFGEDSSDTWSSTDYRENENSSVSVTQTENKDTGNIDITIDATLANSDGWSDVINAAENAASSGAQTNVNVNLGDTELPSKTLSNLCEYGNLTVTVNTPGNISWQIDMKDQDSSLNDKQDLSVMVRKNDSLTEEQRDQIGDVVSFTVSFGKTTLNSTVYIPLGADNSRAVATLYRMNGKKLEKIQSVIVDDDGRAAFSLGETEKGDYIIALNANGVDMDSVMIPPSLYDQYGVDRESYLFDKDGVRYELTGRSSSWGMSLRTVMIILAAVVLVVVVTVGVIMTMLNRSRRAKEQYELRMAEKEQESSVDKEKLREEIMREMIDKNKKK
ncbi:MAG: leucine-rich repeat protein [Clostridiales bacterium]|nr:leucine-rich repeat protein [Clostridiales bacterium]